MKMTTFKQRKKAMGMYLRETAKNLPTKILLHKAYKNGNIITVTNGSSFIMTTEDVCDEYENGDMPCLEHYKKIHKQELTESKQSVDINAIIKQAKSDGYKRVSNIGWKYGDRYCKYMLEIFDVCFDLALIETSFRVIDGGKAAIITHTDKWNDGILIKTEIGEAWILPIRGTKEENTLSITYCLDEKSNLKCYKGKEVHI